MPFHLLKITLKDIINWGNMNINGNVSSNKNNISKSDSESFVHIEIMEQELAATPNTISLNWTRTWRIIMPPRVRINICYVKVSLGSLGKHARQSYKLMQSNKSLGSIIVAIIIIYELTKNILFNANDNYDID